MGAPSVTELLAHSQVNLLGKGLYLGGVHFRKKEQTNHNLTIGAWLSCVCRVQNAHGRLLSTREAQESLYLLESHTREERAEQNASRGSLLSRFLSFAAQFW